MPREVLAAGEDHPALAIAAAGKRLGGRGAIALAREGRRARAGIRGLGHSVLRGILVHGGRRAADKVLRGPL